MLRQSCKKFLGQIQLQSQLRCSSAVGVTRNYHERVVDHYNNPRNVGSFDKNDPTVGTGLVGAPACGDVMKLQIKVDDKLARLLMLVLRPLVVVLLLLLLLLELEVLYEPLSFNLMNYIRRIAVSLTKTHYPVRQRARVELNLATEWVKGRQMDDVVSIKNTEIAKHLSLPPVKLHCSMLAEDAIKAAVKDYEAKRAKQDGTISEAASGEKAAEA
ncbi:Iron-sulfur cluster assembly protein 1 [Bienertia sinuspersici]